MAEDALEDGDWAAVGRAVTERLSDLHMSLSYLARETGLSQTTIRYLGTPARKHNKSTLVAISVVLGWRYDHLAAIPASYVVCERDNILPTAWQERFAERFHADRIARIDAGHQAMNTRPQGLAEILLIEAAA